MSMDDGSSSNTTEILSLYVFKMAKSIAISRRTSLCFDVDSGTRVVLVLMSDESGSGITEILSLYSLRRLSQ
jgi:hypothetical protein